MKKISSIIALLLVLILIAVIYKNSKIQNSSIIVLGDLHYNQMEDHNMEWLKSQSLVQESIDYSDYTNKYWTPFMNIIRQKAYSVTPPVKAIIQLGDLSEGLAGSVEKARQMMKNTVEAIDSTKMPVPWIIAKGNHETYGPGANEAYNEFFIPMFQKQTNNPKINSANYSYNTGNIQITCLDPWDKNTDIIEFLEKEFSSSKAKYKFVAMHEPVVPVSGYCWYAFNQDDEKHNKLMEIIAKNKAIVLSGHLHYYSVLSRKTAYGTIVQAMVLSVVKDSSYREPSYIINEFRPSMADSATNWRPETILERKAQLTKEKEYILSYKQTDLPGYAIIKIDDKNESIILEYYAAFGKKPYDTVNLTKLMSH